MPDGSLVQLSINGTPVYDDDGNFRGYRGTGADVTEQMQAEEALRTAHDRLEETVKERTGELRESNNQLQLITDNLPVLITYIDAQQHYRFVNKCCSEWYGRPVEEILGKKVADIQGDQYEKLRSRIEQVLAGKRLTFDERIAYADGVERNVRVTFVPHHGVNEKVEGYFTLAEDVTEMMQAEERLRQGQKMEAVGQLTGGVAHDFNNLLAVIQGNTELLAESAGDDLPLAQDVLRATARGAELTQRLLAFSRQQPLRPQSIDLAELVGGMSDLLARTLGETIQIEAVADPHLWAASADPGQVESALLNLAINARDAMPGGGKLIIEYANARLDEGYVERNPEAVAGDYVILAVSDTGVGMSPEVQEHAFEPFFTTKDVGEGSGLGLSMVYGFAKQSGGHVSIYSEAGHGTTVKLYLPRAPERSATKTAEPDAVDIPRGQGETILLIEDDDAVRTLAVKILKRLNYDVIDVTDAASARTALEGSERVDLILSDVVLPGGTSGPEFAEEARSRFPHLGIIFMSGYPAEAAKRNGFLGSDRVLLNKPFQRHQLAQALRTALD